MYNLCKRNEVELKLHECSLLVNILIIEPSVVYEYYLFKLNHIRLKRQFWRVRLW